MRRPKLAARKNFDVDAVDELPSAVCQSISCRDSKDLGCKNDSDRPLMVGRGVPGERKDDERTNVEYVK